MTDATHGPDLSSWWTKRAASRREAAAAIRQLRDCQRQMSGTAGNTLPDPAGMVSDEPPSGLIGKSQQIVAGMSAANIELAKLNARRKAADAELLAAREAIGRDAEARARKDAERDAVLDFRARKRGSWLTRKMLQLLAVGLFLGILYVLIEH